LISFAATTPSLCLFLAPRSLLNAQSLCLPFVPRLLSEKDHSGFLSILTRFSADDRSVFLLVLIHFSTDSHSVFLLVLVVISFFGLGIRRPLLGPTVGARNFSTKLLRWGVEVKCNGWFFWCCWPFTFSVCFGYGMQCMRFVSFQVP